LRLEEESEARQRRFALAQAMWQGWHSFRRGLASNLYQLGVQGKTIQEVLRHANLGTMLEIYVKARQEDCANAMVGKLSEAVDVCAGNVRSASETKTPLTN
jgi:integrase